MACARQWGERPLAGHARHGSLTKGGDGMAQVDTAAARRAGEIADAGEAPPHQGFPPASTPVRPVRPAPARWGTAGLSAGEGSRIKDRVTIRGRRLPTEDGAPDAADGLAQSLGVFSLLLGVTEVLGAQSLARWLGMDHQSGLIRFFGMREIGHGIGILMQDSPRARAPWVWTRVAGDALDLGALAPGFSEDNPKRNNVALAATAVVGVTVLDVLCAIMLQRR